MTGFGCRIGWRGDRFLAACALALLTCLTACQQDPDRQKMPGAYRDAHGCLPSGGYVWCQRENACVRSWELASQRGFENSEARFQAYCR